MQKNRDRAAHQNVWDSAFETLEKRQLLAMATEMVTWHGYTREMVEDSWVLTFTDRTSNEIAVARGYQVAAALGVTPESVTSIARGRFAVLKTPGQITEAAVAAAVHQLSFLVNVEPNILDAPALMPNDAMIGQQWPHLNTGQFIPGSGNGLPGADIDSATAWDRQTGSRRVIIAVLDTGIDMFHPDLRDNIWINPGEIPNNGVDDDGNGFIDDVSGWDFGDGDANPQDQPPTIESAGHGTAVAGVIGAVGNNGIGVAGVNWEVSILPLKIFPDDFGRTPLAAQLQAFDYCTMMITEFGHNIVASNNSYGGLAPEDSNFFDTAREIAIQEFTDAGALFVAAAGNESNNNDGTIRAYPASFDNPMIISVAATDNQDRLADFSNWGATTVDLGAPGVRTLTTALGGGYDYIDGTSFASPYTAGVIALLAAASPFATAQQLRDALYAGVEPVEALAGRTVTGGRLNAARALENVQFAGPSVIAISPASVTGPVGMIQVAFNEPVDPAFVQPAGIELRRSGGDGEFDGDDIFIPFAAHNIAFEGSVMTLTVPTGTLTLDYYRLTLRYTYFRDFEGNFLNGDTTFGSDEVYEFQVVAGGGPLEPNDNFSQATPVIVNSAGMAMFENIAIGDGPNGPLDVDLYRVTLLGPGLITVRVDARSLPVPSSLDSYVRLFDASGRELARNDNYNGLDSFLQFFVGSGGRYYIGVSGFGNADYNPTQIATGAPGQSTGFYNISFIVTPATSETITYASSGVVPIPASGTVSSTIFVPDVRSIQDVNVLVDIEHSFVGDLQIYLTSPRGETVPLVLNRGGSGDNFENTVFDQEAATSIVGALPPFTGSFRPEGSLDVFNNDSAEGFWRLTITDTTPLNAGALLGWALQFTLESAVNGPYEFNDTILNATDTQIDGTGSASFTARIGDGAFGRSDVDIFRVQLDAGTTLSATVTVAATGPNGAPNQLDTVLRLFDLQGNQLIVDARADSANSHFSFPVQLAGVYYVAVSGGTNVAYNPLAAGSGVASAATGDYTLRLDVTGGVSDGAVIVHGDNLSVGLNRDGSLGVQAGSDAYGVNLNGAELVAGRDSYAELTEAFFGATFNGYVFKNAGAAQSDLPVSISNQSDYANRRVVVEGLFRGSVPEAGTGGLLVRRALSFGVGDEFIAVDVSLTNSTFSPMEDVGWVEGMRGLQSVNRGSPFTRTVHNRDNATSRLVTSTFYDDTFRGGLTLGLGVASVPTGVTVATSVEAVGGVRDAFQVVDSPVDPDGSVADLGSEEDGVLAVGFNIGELAPGETVHLRYFIFAGTTLAQVQQQFQTLESGNGTGHLVKDPTDSSIAAADLPYAVYYPEGYANDRARTFLPISNPHHVPARVVVIARYEDPTLDAQIISDSIIAPDSRGGVTITTPELYAAGQQLVAKDTPYALEIRSSVPVGATLSHFDFGISTGQAFTSQPSQTWTFSEGFKGQGVNDFLVFLNTSDRQIKATLTVYSETTGQILEFTQEVGPGKRAGWNLGATETIPDGPFAMKLEAEAPVVAALTHFDTNFGGGFGLLGLPSLGALRGVSPEGQLGLNSGTEFVTILNAGDQDAEITFTFLFANQSAFRQTMIVKAGRRSGFNVGQLPGFSALNQPYSITYESNQPVSVSLASFAFGNGTATRFTDQAYTYWMFSEGFRPGVGNAVTEYLRLFNQSMDPVTVEIAIDFAPNYDVGDMGGTETFRRVLTPRAANDFNIHEFITGERRNRDTFYSVTVKAGTPITAYVGRFDAFINGGFGTLGTPLGNIAVSV